MDMGITGTNRVKLSQKNRIAQIKNPKIPYASIICGKTLNIYKYVNVKSIPCSSKEDHRFIILQAALYLRGLIAIVNENCIKKDV